MNHKYIAAVALLGGLLAFTNGCGDKTANETSAPKDAAPAKAAEATPAALPAPVAKMVEQTTNAVAEAVTTVKKQADTALNNATAAMKPAMDAMPPMSAMPTNVKAAMPQPAMPMPAMAPPAMAQPPATLASLPQDQLTQGLKDALGKGVQQAVASLGHSDGFLTNLNVKIPMPDKLQKIESALRAMKQDKLADDFVTTMNRAAEQAVPEAASVFADTVKQMNVADARAILAGPDDAATQYFRKTTQTNLYAKFYPIVQKATGNNGVTQAYKALTEKAKAVQSIGSLGALGGALMDKDTMDVDAYVTDKAMDGLFKMVAAEEKQIRQNPVARTTDLLQKVFGGLKN